MSTTRYSLRFAATTASVAALLAGTSAVALADPPPPPVPQVSANAVVSPPEPTPAPAPAPAPEAQAANPLQPAPPMTGITAAAEGTLTEFFASKNVTVTPLTPKSHAAPRVTIPVPTNWTDVPDPNVPNAFRVIVSKGNGTGIYQSNAQLFVSRLTGDFDVNEALSHGFVETQKLAKWQPTDTGFYTYQGQPSALAEGTYRQDEETLNTSRRSIILTQGKEHYLVQLNVTTNVGNAITDAPATDLIVNGLRFGDAPPVEAPKADVNALADPDAVPGEEPAPDAAGAVPAIGAPPAEQAPLPAPGVLPPPAAVPPPAAGAIQPPAAAAPALPFMPAPPAA